MAGILSKLAGGINTMANELINPQSGIGKLGMFLNAASGNDLGGAQMLAQQQARQQQQDAWEAEDRGLNREYRQAQIQKMLEPPKPSNTYEQIVARLGQGQGDSYLRLLAEGPPIAVDSLNEKGETVRQYMPRGQFGGQQIPGGPVSAVNPGQVIATARQRGFLTPEELASLQGELGPEGNVAMDAWLKGSGIPIGQQVNGKTYYQINGKWYDNPEGR